VYTVYVPRARAVCGRVDAMTGLNCCEYIEDEAHTHAWARATDRPSALCISMFNDLQIENSVS